MPAVLPFTGVLPHPDIPGALLVQPPPELLARATFQGVETVAAWGHPALLPLDVATRLAHGVHDDDQVNDRANATRQTYREARSAARILKGIWQDRQDKAEQAERAAAFNTEAERRRAAEIAAARQDPNNRRAYVEPEPPFSQFEAAAKAATEKEKSA